MRIVFGILLLSLLPMCLLSQTITGRIINVNGEKIPFANVVIKDSVNATTIKEYVLARNGYYSITLKGVYEKCAIVVTANKYLPEAYVLQNPVPGRTYQHDFSLVKDTVLKLPDVTVKAKGRPFQISGDTVKYNVSAYRDGNERKIQDVIKKLPGIQVNEKTGEIKYKGKSVETVKLDGEDLFSSNYAIGTKNINVDMVEQVQAIENYSDNPLLKGIESADKVALNLTLKKQKTDYSGSIDAGFGLLSPNKMATDAATNLLGISQKYKSFATLSYNNIGVNNTPFDYFSYSPNVEQLKEAGILAKRYIPDTYFEIALAPQRSNVNHSLFGSYNSVFKIGKRLSVKTNLCYLNDRINLTQSYLATNLVNGQMFTTADRYGLSKTPTQYRGDIELKYNASPTSLLEYKAKYRKERINTASDVLQNGLAHYNAELVTRDNFFVQTLTYTHKLSGAKALQLVAKQSQNDVPQHYSFLPAIYEPANFASNDQSSRFEKNNINIQANFLGSSSKSKYSLSLGADIETNRFTSLLNGINGNNVMSIASFCNDLRYTKSSAFATANYKLQVNRWRFAPSITGTLLKQHLENSSDKSKDTGSFLIEPTLSIGYKINSYSAMLLTSGYKQKPFAEDYFVINPLYVSNRLVKANEPSLNLQKTKFVSFFYIINNLYRQFQLNIGGSYADTKGNYFSNLFIQQNSTKIIYFFLPEGGRTLTANFLIEKYIPFLESTVRFNHDYSANYYKNIVNGSSLRNNVNQVLTSQLFLKTALDGKINFENTFKHRLLTSKAEGGTTFSNRFLNNNFGIIIKPSKRIAIISSADYYLPDTKQPYQTYLFWDASATLSSKKKIWDWRFTAKNLLNNRLFLQVETNDYSTTSFQTNLLPRYFMLRVTRNF